MIIIPPASEQQLNELARAVRVNRTSRTDEELGDHYQSALLDLFRQGVKRLDADDPLIWQSIKLYCKAHYGYDAGSERFERAYENLSAGIALCGEYTQEGGDTE